MKESKNFTAKEVLHIDSEGTVYLKEGVRRRDFRDSEEIKEFDSEHINEDLIWYSKYLEAKRMLEDDTFHE